ncbi:hypothetical protein CEXT_211401 [Caerostris extrusa]|uniref:Uncharacterized protein n=1 Tax=Caerostris extrusa TaxID=172846 RepID=A0AAV4QD57_CAEEX|nr:hypothetical protein CEXT_211401 [Caerostris extrusa]
MKLASTPVDRIAWHPSYPCPGFHHVHVDALPLRNDLDLPFCPLIKGIPFSLHLGANIIKYAATLDTIYVTS